MRTDDTRSMRIAMIGTRGVPAAYGGFETAVEEIGSRMADAGHQVTVYCRGGERLESYRGMKLVHLPALRLKAAETLSHTALSATHAVFGRKPDAVFVFNAANAPFVPMLNARGIPTAVHVDGLEWSRDKWSGAGRRYYLEAERLAVRWSDALIADAPGIAEYYDGKFGVPTELISYGTKILADLPSDRLAELGLVANGYHVVVARFEPENHVDVIVDGYSRSGATHPLIVVGSAPYAAAHTRTIEEIAARDPRIVLLGGVWDQQQLDQLYAHAITYIHGHSVGGTNPSLLRAMGGGTAVLAWNVVFNRDVLGDDGRYFESAEALAPLVEAAEHDLAGTAALAIRLQQRAAKLYNWDDVTSAYEELARRLSRGYSIQPRRAKRRGFPARPDASQLSTLTLTGSTSRNDSRI
jgi:glycosyltransferase involved in cell wall biosynthesis